MNPKKGKKGKTGYIKGKKGTLYFCEMCDYKCGSQYHINRHYNTKKHIKKRVKKGIIRTHLVVKPVEKVTNNHRDYRGTKRNVKTNVTSM